MKHYLIYSDGSYSNNCVGYGAVILENDTVIHEISGSITDPSAVKHRQVGGELAAVREALLWSSQNGCTSAEIFYDYLGIRCWADGSWKAKTKLTQGYVQFIRSVKISIRWHKVKAHSGNRYNEAADRLAKAGCRVTAPTPSPAAADTAKQRSSTSMLQQEAEHAATDIMAALIGNGLLCSYRGFINTMFARIEILDEGRRCGIIDIYNTKKKRLKVDARGFKSALIRNTAVSVTEKVLQEYREIPPVTPHQ